MAYMKEGEVVELREAGEGSEILLVHAPYPAHPRFDGLPSSLLSACSHLLQELAARGVQVGLIDPGEASEAFYEALGRILRAGAVRVVCIATSTAAIEETQRIVQLVRHVSPTRALVVVGGPHEDDCSLKVAEAVAEVDVSIAGDAEHVLAAIVLRYLSAARSANLVDALAALGELRGTRARGRGTVTSRAWGAPFSREFDFGSTVADSFHERCSVPRRVRFEVFRGGTAVPLSVSRGCTYGGCTFCAEGSAAGRATVMSDFGWIEALSARFPGSPLYFQDSIFPITKATTDVLLPMLKRLGAPWGCQVYLPTLSRRALGLLAEHGCTYLYTGIESGSDAVLAALGKSALSRKLIVERLSWCRGQGLTLGLSVMFGGMASDGTLLETEQTVEETESLVAELLSADVPVAAFYPNIQTVLPGTAVDVGLRERGAALDFYRMPRAREFSDFEDGAVGYNFLTLPSAGGARLGALADLIVSAGRYLASATAGGSASAGSDSAN